MITSIVDVSVVIPCYNASETLLRSLNSIINQVAHPQEIIVVDDGSDVPIEPMVANWATSTAIPVRVLRQPNRGAPSARNLGIKFARSTYVALLDADDAWLPNKLKIQYDFMKERSLAISAHGYAVHADRSQFPVEAIDLGVTPSRTVPKWRFAFGNPFFTPTVMIAKGQFRGFDERFHRVDDYKAWLENFKKEQFAVIDIVLAIGFKPALGHSGLTASIDLMHKTYVEVLATLYRDRVIGWPFYAAALLIESIKLPIRRFKLKRQISK